MLPNERERVAVIDAVRDLVDELAEDAGCIGGVTLDQRTAGVTINAVAERLGRARVNIARLARKLVDEGRLVEVAREPIRLRVVR